MKSLYERLTEAEIPTSSWQSDLYFPVNDKTVEIVGQALQDGVIQARPGIFRSNVDGKLTYEANFMYDPFWAAKSS
jgi:hypothetical protein